MSQSRARTAAVGFALLAACCVIAAAAAAAAVQSGSRDSPDAARLAEVLRIREGLTVGEIGAGDGDLTIAMSQKVGDAGRVFATELGEQRVASLRRAVERAGTANVQVLSGDPLKTNLQAGCCDAVFMRNVYHHFDDPDAMNRSLFESLRPGGMLAVMDFTPRSGAAPSTPRDRDADGSHGVDPDSIAEELKRVGFEVVAVEKGPGRDVLVVAQKPRGQ